MVSRHFDREEAWRPFKQERRMGEESGGICASLASDQCHQEAKGGVTHQKKAEADKEIA